VSGSAHRWVCGALVVCFLLVGCASASQPEVDVLKIGVIAPLEGEFDSLGRSVRNGVLVAAEAWNLNGGVLGHEIQLVLRDSQCDYTGGREAAQSLLDEGVVFIIGAVCADASEGVAQVVSRAATSAGGLAVAGGLASADGNEGALQISPASVHARLTLDADQEVRPTIFRVPMIDPDQGAAAAVFAREALGAGRAGIMSASGSSYGSALATAFRATFEAEGGEVVIQTTYDQDALSFFEALEPVREANPDLLYLPGYHTVANVLVAQARSFGLLQPVLGSDGWDSHALDLAAVDGAYFTTHFYPEEPSAAVRAWADLYQARYLAAPDALATLSYDAADLLLTAIHQTGAFDPFPVAQTLETMTFDGLSGSMAFNTSHNPVRTMVVVRAVGGRLAYVGRYAAPEAPPSLSDE
jgi:branched-chain amino acid transport system substrate-binding protein